MPSGQRRGYKPYYYYDFESKSACVKFHVCASSNLSHSCGAPDGRDRQSRVTYPQQSGMSRTVSAGRAGNARVAKRPDARRCQPLRTTFRVAAYRDESQYPPGKLYSPSVLQRPRMFRSGHCNSLCTFSFPNAFNELRDAIEWIAPCIVCIESRGGRVDRLPDAGNPGGPGFPLRITDHQPIGIPKTGRGESLQVGRDR